MERRRFLASAGAAALAGLLPAPSWARERGLTGYLRTNWSRDPHAFGSYSYIARGARARDHRVLGEPEGALYFAGEATHPHRNSTIHAAYESGLIAADRVADTPRTRIAVIGAGVAGLAAAHRLASDSRDVIVFEARSRIGGRLWTDRSLGVPLDLGGSWIHGIEGNPLTALADDLGLPREPTPESGIQRGGDGRAIAWEQGPSWMRTLVEVQATAGADPGQINELAYLGRSDYGGPDVVFPGGYDGILAALSGDYEVRLGHAVTAIEQGPGDVLIHHRGATERFDAAVVTLPLGVLKAGAIRFTPALSENKQRAIDRLGMGTLDKLYLQFDAVFWDPVTWIGTPETRLSRGELNLWLNMAPIVDAPILAGFSGGRAALALAELDDDALLSAALDILDNAYPT